VRRRGGARQSQLTCHRQAGHWNGQGPGQSSGLYHVSAHARLPSVEPTPERRQASLAQWRGGISRLENAEGNVTTCLYQVKTSQTHDAGYGSAGRTALKAPHTGLGRPGRRVAAGPARTAHAGTAARARQSGSETTVPAPTVRPPSLPQSRGRCRAPRACRARWSPRPGHRASRPRPGPGPSRG